MTDYAILGAGAMGTAIGFLLASNGNEVLMWTRRKKVAKSINKEKVNSEYMPYLFLPEKIKATVNIKKCVESSDNLVFAIPSHAILEICEKIKSFKMSKKICLSVIKGMEAKSKRTISEVLKDELKIEKNNIVVLSGPNFAIEIVENIPTIGVLGCKQIKNGLIFQKALTTEHFIAEVTDDSAGVEIGGILKNIGAIAMGIIDGLNLGDNTRGFIFSQYFKEALEIGVKIFKAKEGTLMGHACLGDMIATSFSLKSRNRIIGLLASKSIKNIPKDTFIAEGKNNAEILKIIARKNKIDAPVTNFVSSVLAGKKPVVAFNRLWRKFKSKLSDFYS